MSFVRTRIILIAVVVVAVAGAFSLGQSEFKNGTFELGQLTELTGVFHADPYPMLLVKLDENTYKNVLLVGFGKAGAEKAVEDLEGEYGSLAHQQITVKGTLIYYNGRTLFQLEPNPNAEGNFIKVGEEHSQNIAEVSLGEVEMEGEIVDPKCYFGVMKPGRGKIHRSCAVRCISGGIPPVLVTTNDQDESQYYLITDREGKAVNQQVLDKIGKPSRLKGDLVQMGDWMQLRLDPEKDIEELGSDSEIY